MQLQRQLPYGATRLGLEPSFVEKSYVARFLHKRDLRDQDLDDRKPLLPGQFGSTCDSSLVA